MDEKALILDETVFQAFKEGDNQAFSKVFEAFKRLVYITTIKIVGSPEEAEDLTTQTFVKAWERRNSVASLLHLKNLLLVVARNLAIDFLRGKANKSFLRAEDVSDDVDGGVYARALTDQIVADLVQDIYAAIEKLPKVRREVFRLRYMEEMSPDEIAVKLKMNVENVYLHTKRAMRELRQSLGRKTLIPSQVFVFTMFLIFPDLLLCVF